MLTPVASAALGFDTLALREPDRNREQVFRAHQGGVPWSYGPVGATRSTLPEGWDHDAMEVVLGGADRFDDARAALGRFVMFDLPWVHVHHGSGQRPGDLVTFHSWQYGVWMLHACRVVYAIVEPDRVGFAYGTLRGHAVAGEEQFAVHRSAGRTLFTIRKFSRLAHPAARLAGPLARGLQRRFSVEAGARMQAELRLTAE
jgi:uncharacterized protein (UPF0548 family)